MENGQDADQLDVQEVEDDENVLDIDPEQEVMPVTYDITSYGADYPVDGLVKRLAQGDIVVPTFHPEYEESDEIRGFQRRFVWSRPQMDKFVESLLLGLPVPGVFFVRDRSNVLLVLDGQQRLRTLHDYYRGVHKGREYKLKHVQEPFKGKSYEELEAGDRRRLDDSIIHATILRQEQPEGSQDAVYSIFERLNTGGSPLQPQEIRVALYHGPFLNLVSKLNEDPAWRRLYGAQSPRFKDQELILRVLALFENSAEYSRPVKGFLNDYLAVNRQRGESESADLADVFKKASRVVLENVGPRAFRPVRPLNAAVLDSVMVGVMRRLESGPIDDGDAMADAYTKLIGDKEYIEATTSSTAAEESVQARLRLATETFASLR